MSSAPLSPIVLSERAGSEPSAGHDRAAGRRPALDGVRALAVLSVLVYHFGGGDVSWLPGGFLGVDVFFVLSGYLITGLLVDEYTRRGRIDLLGFWTRRLRRLAPALIVVLLAVSAWIWWATPPDAYPNRRADIFWTIGYLANWHFIATSESYFAAFTSASPLRHAWSLAVEEQFYLLWPTLVFFLLLLGVRIGRRLPRLGGRGPVVAAAGLGVALSAWSMASLYSPLNLSKAYYSTQGRVQELFVGVLLAVLVRSLSKPLPQRAALIAVAGLLVLLAAICVLPDSSAFYFRGGALLISLAAAAVIGGVELWPGGALARAFSWRPAVAVGRISYGVYLWHWPLVVAIPVVTGQPFAVQAYHQGLRLLITVAAATASFFLIETPILRSRRILRSPGRVIAAALTASALVVAVAIPATALPGTLAQQVSHSSDRSCSGERDDFLVSCLWPRGAAVSERPVRLAILGDSTARALSPGLDDWANRTASTWLEAAWKRCTSTGLLVIPSNLTSPDIPASTCTAQAPDRIRQALQEYRPPTVLVAEFWASYQPILLDGRLLKPGTPQHAAALRAGYLRIVDEVAAYGGHVYFQELPPPGEPLGRVIAAGRPAGHARGSVTGRYVDSFNAVLRSVAQARPDVASTVSITDVICPGGVCGPLQGGMLVRADGVHYSIPFSRRLVPVLMSRIGLAPNPNP